MTDSRPIGLVLVVAGAVGIVLSALADPLGIGREEDVFGWLQITGVVIGAVVALLGVALATEWVPLPGRSRQVDQVGTGGQNTTIVTETSPPPPDRPPDRPTS
jgi:hypothetical protein